MAFGFESVHPTVEAVLRELGVATDDVTQGWGDAAASAGTHAPTGAIGKRKFGRCVDLRSGCVNLVRETFDRFLAGGLILFDRKPPQWSGMRHWHCVFAAHLDGETKDWPGWVRVQVQDFLEDRNGLVSHLGIDGFHASDNQKARLRSEYGLGEHLAAVTVYRDPGAFPLGVYAFLEEDEVRCELRPLATALGAEVVWEPTRPTGIRHQGREIVVPAEWKPQLEGSLTRVLLRPVVEWCRRKVEWVPEFNRVNIT